MDFFLSINGNDFAKENIDFCDDFLFGMVVQRNNIFGKMFLILGSATCT